MNETMKPSVALLSNSQYSVMVTAAGAGYSTWRGLDVTRWREDATRDCWGQFCYVRNLTDDRIWSIGYQPLCGTADEYEFEVHADRAEFQCRDGNVETRWAICVVLVRQLLQWRTYTRRRGMELDLVILDQRTGEPGERLRGELQSGVDSEMLGKSGGIFVLGAD